MDFIIRYRVIIRNGRNDKLISNLTYLQARQLVDRFKGKVIRVEKYNPLTGERIRRKIGNRVVFI